MISALLLALPLLPGDVLVVRALGGPGVDFTEVAAAVAAARPGDTILVQDGFYLGIVLDGKGLVVTADEGATAVLDDVVVRNLPADQSVALRGLRIIPSSSRPGLVVESTLGPVWVEDVDVEDTYAPLLTKPGLLAEDAANLTVIRGEIVGNRAISGVDGGPGLLGRRSNVQLYDTVLRGGNGLASIGEIRLAGPAAVVESGRVYAAAASLLGGDGGYGGLGGFPCTDGGDGGPGLSLGIDAPLVRLLDATVEGGAAGGTVPPCVPGRPGPAEVVLSGSVVRDPGAARTLTSDALVPAGGALEVSVAGRRGDVVLLLQAAGQAPRYLAGGGALLGGVLLPGLDRGFVRFLGRIDASGSLARSLRAPAVLGAETFYSQAVVVARTGEIVFSGGGSTTVLGAP